MKNLIRRIFCLKDARPNTDDNDLKTQIPEIEEPVFKLKAVDNDNNTYEYTLVVTKPNCCIICRELLKSPLTDNLIDEHGNEITQGKVVADLVELCHCQKSWSEWDSGSKLKRLKFATEALHKSKIIRYRRYCLECVARLLVSQIENQQGVKFDLASKSLQLKCMICHDYAASPHYITKSKALIFLSHSYLDSSYLEKFNKEYELYIEQRNVNNKHCPVPDCLYYTKRTSRISCPEHGTFCGYCFERMDNLYLPSGDKVIRQDNLYLPSGDKVIDIEPHKCPGVPRALINFSSLRRCPSCNSLVEKNGGCRHMTCPCGDEFYWDELKPIKPKKFKKAKKPLEVPT